MGKILTEKVIKEAFKIPFKNWTEKNLPGFGNREYSAILKKEFKIEVNSKWGYSLDDLDKNKPWLENPIYGLRITQQEFFEKEILNVQTNKAYPLFKKLEEEGERMLQEKIAKDYKNKTEKLSHLLKILG